MKGWFIGKVAGTSIFVDSRDELFVLKKTKDVSFKVGYEYEFVATKTVQHNLCTVVKQWDRESLKFTHYPQKPIDFSIEVQNKLDELLPKYKRKKKMIRRVNYAVRINCIG